MVPQRASSAPQSACPRMTCNSWMRAVESLGDHHALMAAIEKRDTRQAVKLMTMHLSGVEKGLVLKEEAPRAADLKSALG